MGGSMLFEYYIAVLSAIIVMLSCCIAFYSFVQKRAELAQPRYALAEHAVFVAASGDAASDLLDMSQSRSEIYALLATRR